MKKDLLPTMKFSAFVLLFLATTIVFAQFNSFKSTYAKTSDVISEGLAVSPGTDFKSNGLPHFTGTDVSFSGVETVNAFARSNTFIKNTAVQFGGLTIGDPKLADVDGDGDLDVFANMDGYPYGVAYYKNDGAGNFAAATVIPGINDANFYLGDLDGDGDVDIIVPTNWTTQTYGKVFLNDGAGNFTVMPGSFISTHAYYPLAKIVDINKDGLNDIIYSGVRMPDGASNTEIWLNTGTIGHPNFALAQTIQNYTPTGNSLAVADIDGDGDLDMVSGGNSWPALVYVNNGGTFADPYEISGYSSSVFLIDWDNDGDMDLLRYDAYNNSGLYLHKNDGHGNFDANGTLLFDRTQTGFNLDNNEMFQFADVDKDGFLDAIVTNGVNGTRVLLNKGCNFVLQPYILGTPPVNGYVGGMVAGDITNDGFPDIISTFGGNDAAVYINDLLQTTPVPLPLITGTTGATFAAPKNVTLSATAHANETIKWWDAPVGGTLLATGSSYATFVSANTTVYVDATNSNGCVSARKAVSATFKVRTNTFVQQTSVQFGGLGLVGPRLGDVDGDGDLDVIAERYSNPYAIMLFKNDGSGNFDAGTVIPGINDASYELGDLDGDGDLDIIVSTNWTSQTYGKIFLNDGHGNFTLMPGSFISGLYGYPLAKIIDINQDGKNDIIYAGIRMPDGTYHTEIWLNTGTTGNANFALSQTIIGETPTGNSIDVADIDGDGDLDMVTGGNSWPAQIYVNNGGTFAPPYELTTNDNGYAGNVYLIDWDNDGDKDLVRYDGYNNSGLYLNRNDGHGNFEATGTLLFNNAQTGFPLSQVSDFKLADVNNDGYLDAVLFNQSSSGGFIRVLLNTGCSFVLQPYALGEGYGSGLFVGDLDNDGFQDLGSTFYYSSSAIYLNDLLQATAVPLSNITSTTGATVCGSGSVTLSAVASNNGTINWYDVPTGGRAIASGPSYSPSVTVTTTYYVDATNSNGCVSARVPVSATIGQAPVASITSSGSTVCGTNTVTLTASAGSSYLWSNGATTQSITVNSPGSYTVKVFNAAGCSAKSAPYTVSAPANTATFTTLAVDADIKNNGLLIAANNLGAGAAPVSVNGVCFSNSPANLTNFANGGGAFCQDCIPGSNLKKLLDALVFQPNGNESTLTIGGLTSCHRYRLQLIYSNDVNSTGNNINVNVNGVTYSFSNWIPAAKILTVEFTASSASTVVRFLSNNGAEPNRAVLNGYAMHDLDMPNNGACNSAPVANAGADINAGAAANCIANVTLNGSASTDPDGVNTISSYTWKEGQTILGTGVSLSTNFSIGTHTVTLEVRDNWGIVSTDNVVIIVNDATPPSITCTPSISTNATSAAGALVNYTAPVGTDNCSAATTTRTQGPASGSVFPIGTTVVTYTVTDAAGLSASCSFNVIVTGLPPVINCPQNITVNSDAGKCGANVDFAATETTGNPVSTITYSIAPGSLFAVGTTTVTTTATNSVGTSSCNFTVTVKDNQAPVPTIEALPIITGECSATVTVPTAMDNCAGLITATTVDPTSFTTQGTYTIVWSYADGNGNNSTQTQQVVVKDITAPVPTVATLPTLSAQCSVTASAPTANDNCSGLIIATTADPTSYSAVGTYTINWTYNDGNGNTSSQTQTVVVLNDVTAPVPLITVLPTLTGDCSVTASAHKANDNCSGIITATTLNPVTYTIQGTYIITWKYTDAAGNATLQTQNVIVKDITAPVPVVAALPTVTGECSAVVSTRPKAMDACTGLKTGTTTDPLSYNTQGTYTIHWTYTDNYGNRSYQNQTVIVKDVTAPVPAVTTLPTLTAQCSVIIVSGNHDNEDGEDEENEGDNDDHDQDMDHEGDDDHGISNVHHYRVPFALDNCKGWVKATTSDPLTYTVPGTYTIHWIYNDGNGNSSSQDQTVIVKDVTKPVISDVPNKIVNCGAPTDPSVTGSPVASDNCSAVTISSSDVTNGNIITRTWKATDASGNFSTSVQLITMGSLFNATVSSVPTNNTYTGGVNTNLYLGYGAQSTVLQIGNLPSGGAPYTYAWTGANTNRLSSTTSASPVFTPNAAGYSTFTVTVTNKYNCKSNATISICVTDIRVTGTGGSKVNICHNGQTIQVSVNAVSSHIGNHGSDRLGSCDQAPCNGTVSLSSTPIITGITKQAETIAVTTEEELKVTVMPNPSTTHFTLKLESRFETPISMRVMDGSGRVVDAKSNIGANSTIQIGHNYSSGTYYAELIQGAKRKVVQLMKVKE